MATSVIEPARSIGDSFSSQNLDHLQSEELSQMTTADKAWSGSYSKSNATPDNCLLSDTLNANKFDFSCNQQSQLKDKDVDKNKSYLDTTPSEMNCRSGVKGFETNMDIASFKMNSNNDIMPQSYFESQFGKDYESTKRSRTPMAEKKSENKWDFSSDQFSFSTDRPKPSVSNLFDNSKSKIDHLAGVDLKSRDYESDFKNFDFELMKKTYNFDSSNQTLKPERKDSAKGSTQSKQYSNFEDSEFALKLRSSLHSDFLTNELRNDKPSKPEVKIPESSGSLRTIDEILKQYGITDNSPGKPGQLLEEADTRSTGISQVGLTGYSRNVEISSGLNIGSSTAGITALNSQDKDGIGTYPSSVNVSTLFRTDITSSSSNLDSKNSTTSNSTFTVNCSQNNETTATSQNPENEPLKKSGSSVDYSARVGLYGSSSYRSFDYGKATSFAGENSRPSVTAFLGKDGKQYEGNIDRIKFEGSQVDVGGSGFNINKSTPFDIIKNMGSLTDALEYSMSSERQRLRKLDTMISATPFNYSSIEVSRALKPQYLSPERSYSALRTNPLTGRGMYSTSNLQSSSGHGAGMSSRNHVVRSTGHRDAHVDINKSISAPGTGERNLKTGTRHESSVDPSVPFSPYRSRGYNFQYNNAYNPQLLDKISGQRNPNKPQKKVLPSKKRECCSKNKKEDCGYGNSQSLYSQNTSGIDFLKTLHVDKNNPADRKRYSAKPEVKKPVCAKKNSGGDVNYSKQIGNIYDGFDFVKDLNRMWKNTVFGAGLPDKSNQKQPKYKPYKPVASSSNEKKESSKEGRKAREIGGKDLAQPIGKRGDNSWAVPARKHNEYDSVLDFNSAHRIRSQSSLEPFRSVQLKGRPSTCSLAKQKPIASSGTTKKHAVTTPKSILKQSSSKATCGTSTEMDRPHSAMVLPSQSYTQPLYQTSYHLIRGFSPVEFQKNCRTSTISTTMRNQESTTKHKPTSRTSKNGPKK